MERQKYALRGLLDRIVLKDDVLTLDMFTFSNRIEAIVEGIDSPVVARNQFNTFFESPVDKKRSTDYTVMYEKLEQEENGSIVVMVTDGRPWIKMNKKAKKQACRVAKNFKKTHPDSKVYCFQSAKAGPTTVPFFKCSCDFVWRPPINSPPSEAYNDGLEMGDDICLRVIKKPSVCTPLESKKECTKLTGDKETGNVDPTQRGKMCKWHKKNGCGTNGLFKKFYDDSLAIP